MKLLFEHAGGTIHLDPSIPCTVYRTSGFMSSEDYRTFALGHLSVFEKEQNNYPNLCAILTDTREQDTVEAEDLDWLQSEWMPKAKAIGVRFIAMMVSDNVFGQYAVEDFAENAPQNEIQVLMFNDWDKAKEWLKEQSERRLAATEKE